MLIDINSNHLTCYKEFEFFCFKNCCRNILEYNNIKNAKYYVNCSLDFTLLKDSNFKLGYKNIRMTDIQSVIGDYPLVKNNNKVLLHKESRDNSLDVWNENKRKIDNGIPLIVFMDMFELYYNPIFHNKEHGLHSVILNGYKSSEEKAIILDWYQQHWSYNLEMDMHDFFKARESDNPMGVNVASDIPIHNSWVEIEREGWNCEYEELLIKTIDITINQYYSFSNQKNDGYVRGISALKIIYKICSDYLKSRDKYEEEFFKELYINTFMLTKNKNLFKWYIESASNEVDSSNIKVAMRIVENIASSWNTLLLVICKCSMAYTETLHKRVIDLFAECINMEEKLYDTLYSIKYEIQ